MMLKIAVRSILRNMRRTAATVLTIAIGAASLLVFGAFMLFAIYGLQTATVQDYGHLAVYRTGYFTFGSGNPAAWGISNYSEVLASLKTDSELASLIDVVTPIQVISGIIANGSGDSTKTLFGVGFVPSDRDRMKQWDEYGTGSLGRKHSGLTDSDPTQGIIGTGLARILGLCNRLHVAECPEPVAPPMVTADLSSTGVSNEDFSSLPESSAAEADDDEQDQHTVQLLGATVGGAPNVVRLSVHRAEYQGVKEVDDSYVGVHTFLSRSGWYTGARSTQGGLRVWLYYSVAPTRSPQHAHAYGSFLKLTISTSRFEISPN